jgi:hypothetical protein
MENYMDKSNQLQSSIINKQPLANSFNDERGKTNTTYVTDKLNNFKIKQSFLILLMLVSMKTFAQQGAPIKYVDQLEEEEKVLVHKYRNVFKEEEIKNVEKLDSEHSKISYTRNAINYEAVVNSNRKDLLVVATCQEIPVEKLPAIVKNGFQKSKYGSNNIEKAFSVSTPYSSNFYRIDVQLKEKKEKSIKSLFYDDKGLFKEPPY